MQRFTDIMSLLRKLVLAFLLAMSTPSCSTQKVAQRETSIRDFNARASSYDSLLLSRQQYDSIYIEHQRWIDAARDTVWIREQEVKYRYKYLHDTLSTVRTDTLIREVAQVREVEVERQTPRPLRWYDYVAYASFLLLVVLLLGRIRWPVG